MKAEQIKAQEARMAEFMGLTQTGTWKGTFYYDGNGNMICGVSEWQPATDLNQLFKVVDAICEKTGWGFDTISGASNIAGFYSFFFYDQLEICEIDKGTREASIFASCVSALDHIEGSEE